MRILKPLLTVAAGALASAAASQTLPAPIRPTSPAPPPFGQDMISSGIPERVAQLRAEVLPALHRGTIAQAEAEQLALTLARMQQQLQFHTPRGLIERRRLNRRLDGIEERLRGRAG